MSARTIDETAVADFVRDATAAPSMHNAQPWRFDYASATRTFGLYADLERALPRADPANRGLHIGCGAALLNLRTAAEHAGWRPDTSLLPDPDAPALLASVRLAAPTGATEGLAVLHSAIHERHTSRCPFADRRIPADVREALAQAAHHEGATLAFPAGAHLQNVLDQIRDAECYDHMDEDKVAETERWTRASGADRPADGIPEHAFGPRVGAGTAPVRDFAGHEPVPGRAVASFEDRPQIALLGTREDGPADWLRAGQALERVLLVATLLGLGASFATQPLEWPELRWVMRDPISGSGQVQMVLRLGYGTDGPGGPATPRRPVKQVLTFED
ncbi:Acg family FMN-binding oxidoreductase [Streptomyces sp. NRRL F-5135]|uniref:Acg family FMN-binding oxidoreductase n=1 Tax=Streptomyces sp. NRRL F-5135 TaxID=1463858 RepID=UPI0004C55148|nr:nitroreductase family protein [Streptomyces sp. NRRL F-5135]